MIDANLDCAYVCDEAGRFLGCATLDRLHKAGKRPVRDALHPVSAKKTDLHGECNRPLNLRQRDRRHGVETAHRRMPEAVLPLLGAVAGTERAIDGTTAALARYNGSKISRPTVLALALTLALRSFLVVSMHGRWCAREHDSMVFSCDPARGVDFLLQSVRVPAQCRCSDLRDFEH